MRFRALYATGSVGQNYKDKMPQGRITLTSWLQKIYRLWPQHIPAPLAILYDKVAAPGLSRFHQQIAREFASAAAGGTVLDIGTGPGHLLVEIARSDPGLKLVGFDLSRGFNLAQQGNEELAALEPEDIQMDKML